LCSGNYFIFCLSLLKTWFNIACYPIPIPKQEARNGNIFQRALAGLRETELVTGSRGEALRVLADTEQIIRRRQEKASATVGDCIRQLKHLGYTSEEMKTLIFDSI